MSRKSKYETHIQPNLEVITELIKEFPERAVAERFGVSERSWLTYKEQHAELKEAILKGQQDGKEAKIKKYKSLLEKRAEGFHYTETKKVIRNVDGVKTQIIEEYEKYSPPDVGAIHLLLKNLDDDWRNDDKSTINLKKEKLELERLKTEMNDW